MSLEEAEVSTKTHIFTGRIPHESEGWVWGGDASIHQGSLKWPGSPDTGEREEQSLPLRPQKETNLTGTLILEFRSPKWEPRNFYCLSYSGTCGTCYKFLGNKKTSRDLCGSLPSGVWRQRMPPSVSVNRGWHGHQASSRPWQCPRGGFGWRETGYRPQVGQVSITGMIASSPDSCLF